MTSSTATKNQAWQAKLDASRQELLALLNSLTPEEWSQTVFSEGEQWAVQTVVSHLIDSERGMSIHVHKIRKGEETLPPDFDIDRWNAKVTERISDQSPAALLEGLQATRSRTLGQLGEIQENEWSLTGRHPARGIITIDQYYETIHGHEVIHTRDIASALGR